MPALIEGHKPRHVSGRHRITGPGSASPLGPSGQETPIGAPFIPESSGKKEYPRARNTCIHELLHAIVLEGLGYTPKLVSVKEDKASNSKGRVIVGGHINPLDFQVFAAASSISFEGYKPAGTGSDRAQIEAIAERYGGHSFDSALRAAQAIISGISEEVLHRAANILDTLGEIPGSVSGILAQARYQTSEKTNDVFFDSNQLYHHEPEPDSVEPDNNSQQTTMIETFDGNRGRISLYEGTMLIGRETYCTLCLGRGDTHAADCSANNRETHPQKGDGPPKSLTRGNRHRLVTFPGAGPLTPRLRQSK